MRVSVAAARYGEFVGEKYASCIHVCAAVDGAGCDHETADDEDTSTPM